jgi:8-oxo-dGTP pyrophosphatase MutT (NUDIX family)
LAALSEKQNKYQSFISDPDLLLTRIREKLGKREIKTFQYEKVSARKAAVIIPLFFKNHEAHLLFTKRTDKVEHHKGQISFPGGMQDATDVTLQDTAVRETWEEMGIQAEDLTILGRTDNFLTNTHFMVTPFVAYFEYPYQFHINPHEIAKVIEVPLSHLLNPDIFRTEQWLRNGILWDVHFYDYNDETIWGVTGFLLSNFISIVFELTRIGKSKRPG